MTSYFPVRTKLPCRNCVSSEQKKIGNKKPYHISLHCVSKEIGNQQLQMLSPMIFLEVLLLKVNAVMLLI